MVGSSFMRPTLLPVYLTGARGPNAAGRGVGSCDRDHSGPRENGAAMSDKSPRQTMTKKSGKSLKEKRAVKRAKADRVSSTDALLHPKKR